MIVLTGHRHWTVKVKKEINTNTISLQLFKRREWLGLTPSNGWRRWRGDRGDGRGGWSRHITGGVWPVCIKGNNTLKGNRYMHVVGCWPIRAQLWAQQTAVDHSRGRGLSTCWFWRVVSGWLSDKKKWKERRGRKNRERERERERNEGWERGETGGWMLGEIEGEREGKGMEI